MLTYVRGFSTGHASHFTPKGVKKILECRDYKHFTPKGFEQ